VDWPEYQRRSDAPHRFTRWHLTQLLELLEQGLTADAAQRPGSEALTSYLGDAQPLQAALRAALASPPLPQPRDFRGGPALDMLALDFGPRLIGDAQALLRWASEQAVRTPDTAPRGLGGFAEAWADYARTLSSTTAGPATMSTPTERVQALIDGFNRNDIDAVLACFAEDAIYHNMPMEPLQGLAAIRAGLAAFMDSASEIDWQVRSSAEVGNKVLNERLDRFLIGGQWLELPVMGTFEVANDRITHWRDYFDLADFQQQMAQIAG
jgi:limonene-1,2-epoxide hydrolase